MTIKPLDVLHVEQSTGQEACVICGLKIEKGIKIIAVGITVGSSFMKALQKTIRKEVHVQCAEDVQTGLSQRIAEAKAR